MTNKFDWLTENLMVTILRKCEVLSVRWVRHKDGREAIKPTEDNPESFGPWTAEQVKKRHDWIFTHTHWFLLLLAKPFTTIQNYLN